MNRILSLLLGLAAVAGSILSCGDIIVDPKLPPGATQFTPPTVFATWWEMTEVCSGRTGSLDAVSWYKAPANFFVIDGRQVSAYWSAGSNQIVVSESVARNGHVVRHEMLHALLRSKGHARDDFLERCAGRVACTTQCVEDAGPAPEVPTSVPRVHASMMEVTMEITPIPVRSWVNDGYFAVTIRARNPAPNPVLVELPSQGTSQISYSYFIMGPNSESGVVPALDNSVASFAAGETKVHVFDFFADNQGTRQGHIYPGQYVIRGTYGGYSAPDLGFQAH